MNDEVEVRIKVECVARTKGGMKRLSEGDILKLPKSEALRLLREKKALPGILTTLGSIDRGGSK